MTYEIKKVDYFYVEVGNKAGEAAPILAGLRDAGVNLLAFSGFPSGRKTQLDFVAEDTAQFKAAAKKLKLQLSAKKAGFLLRGEDRAGALTEILDKLAAAKLSITALDAVTSGDGRFGAIFWVKPEHVAKAAKLLGAKK
jgi:hypothetical protein